MPVRRAPGFLHPLRRSRAWAIVGALSITETVSWGVLYYAFSVFLLPMRRELDVSIAELTGAFSLALLISGVAGIGVGRYLDDRSPRAHDRRLGRRGAAGARVVARREPRRVLRAVQRDRVRDGGRALRARVHGDREVVPGRRAAPAGADRADARRGAGELHLPPALAGADRRSRLARRARHPRPDPRRRDDPAARARASPGARGATVRHPSEASYSAADALRHGRSGCSRPRSSWPRSPASR